MGGAAVSGEVDGEEVVVLEVRGDEGVFEVGGKEAVEEDDGLGLGGVEGEVEGEVAFIGGWVWVSGGGFGHGA